MALLVNTASHSLTVTPPVNEADPAWWERFTDHFPDIQTQAFKVMRDMIENQMPTYYVRYEDLVLKP